MRLIEINKIFFKPNYFVKSEDELWNIPLDYIPYSSLSIQIPNWDKVKNNIVESILKKDFLECGCVAGTYSLMITSILTIVLSIFFIEKIKDYYLNFIFFSFFLNCFISLFTKSILVIYSRIRLKNKIQILKRGQFNFESINEELKIQEKGCGCNSNK